MASGVHPDAITLALSDPAYPKLLSQFAPANQHPWRSDVASQLERNALQLAQNEQPLTTNNASAVRLAALCLAIEAKGPTPKLADLYQQIALGVTLLQHRNTKDTAAREQIILATD